MENVSLKIISFFVIINVYIYIGKSTSPASILPFV